MKLAYKKVLLVNEVGDEFTALSTEEFKPIAGELIFNTAMTGFTEILTDPSYINQIINFTSSHIGNYGVTKSDFESNKPKIQAAIGNSFSYKPSSWRSEIAITDWLKKYEIPFTGGFDSRMITSYLRNNGSSMFALGVEIKKQDLINLLKKTKNIIGDDSALTAGKNSKASNDTKGKIGILDLGSKNSIEKVLEDNNFEALLINPETEPDKILNYDLKGLIISNGPGDPRSLQKIIRNVESLVGKIPIFGICLGHQILSLSCGLIVEKMKFGHHGSNHPVKVEGIDNAIITSQNHGFCVSDFPNSLKHEKFGNISSYAVNLYDNTNAGISLWGSNAYSVQFHPEAGPGTNDALKVFEPFFEMITGNYAKE